MPQSWRDHYNDLRPPVDMQLEGTSSWINLVTKRDQQVPQGWKAHHDVQAKLVVP